MKLLKEPLLHFFVLGCLIFAAHTAVSRGEKPETHSSPIRITAADLDWLREGWMRQWRRLPTNEDLRSLLVDHVREEVLAREAKALELDVGDTIVRRRLAQKMSFLIEDTVRIAEPPESELRALYETRPDLTGSPPRVSFEQIFFRRDEGDDRARVTLAALSDGVADAIDRGDGLLLGEAFSDHDELALTNLFGDKFAHAVLNLPVGKWSGPFESAYGVHLVKVTTAFPSRPRPFLDVRERLLGEWRRAHQEAAQAQLLQGLARKYRVTVDPALRQWIGPLSDSVEVGP